MAKKKSDKKKTSSSLSGAVGDIYRLMRKENLSAVSWEENSFSLEIKRRTLRAEIPLPPAGEKEVQKEEDKEVKEYIRSPMNGIFYEAPTPGADPFINEGEEVQAGSTVCIIEAMKLMNEVQIERSCRIKKIIAKNASAVKVNDPLFEVKHLG